MSIPKNALGQDVPPTFAKANQFWTYENFTSHFWQKLEPIKQIGDELDLVLLAKWSKNFLEDIEKDKYFVQQKSKNNFSQK